LNGPGSRSTKKKLKKNVSKRS